MTFTMYHLFFKTNAVLGARKTYFMLSGPIMCKLRGASAAYAFKMLTGKRCVLMSNPAAQ